MRDSELLGLLLFITLVGVLINNVALVHYYETGHVEMGKGGHVCFANHTCRDNLRCVFDEKLFPDGVCIR